MRDAGAGTEAVTAAAGSRREAIEGREGEEEVELPRREQSCRALDLGAAEDNAFRHFFF